MSLTSNNKILWADIEELYNSLNLARDKFNITQITVPDNSSSKAQISHIEDLKDGVQAMTSHPNLTTIASTQSVQLPSIGSLLEPLPFAQLETIIDNIQAANAATFYGTTASREGSNFSGFYGTTASRNGSNFTRFYGTTFYATVVTRNRSGFYGSTSSANRTAFFSAGANKNKPTGKF